MANRTSRIGAISIHEIVLDIGNDGSSDGLCSLKGVMGSLFNLQLSKLQKRGYRCQFIVGEKLGVYDESSDSYTGLLGQLQRGELDSVAMPVFFPLNDSKDSFAYSPPLLEDTMTIFSVYNTTTESHVGDVFSMFASVPQSLWIGFFISFVAFAFVSYLGARLLRKSHSGVWLSVCAFLDQDSHEDYYPSSARYFAILISVTMMGLFFIMAYRSGCVSTDLVTIDKPIVIKTYNDIIDRGVTTGFGSITPEWGMFANAPRGSRERKIFENSIEINFSPNTFVTLLEGLIHQKKCIIGRPFIAKIAAMANVAAPSWIKECACYVAPDPHAKKYTTVFVRGSNYKHSTLYGYANTLTMRMSAHGFANYAMERTHLQIIEQLFGVNALPPSKLNKITSHIEEKSGDIIDITWRQYRRAMVTWIGLVGAAFVLLVIETIYFNATAQLKPRGMKRNVRKYRSYNFHQNNRNWDKGSKMALLDWK